MTVRVDDETRILMESLEGVNGSEILRERILEGLERETRRNRMDALRIMERLYRKPHPGWDSTKFIRAMRESRYGPAVVDASVVEKWFLDEEHGGRALGLRLGERTLTAR